ncbi:D-alanyl-D-alanine carboxypeptidase family protein [Patescibacteria group bacterium]
MPSYPETTQIFEVSQKENPGSSEIATTQEIPFQIEALSACVFDILNNSFIYELNADTQRPLASLTKLMTAIVAKENLLPSTLVEISKEALLQEGDSGLIMQEKWNLSDILKIMLISSSNDAAYAVASSLKPGLEITDKEFVEIMNKKVLEMGLKKTYFINATGLDISENLAGAYGTCKEMSSIIKYILINYPDLLEPTTKDYLSLGDRTFKNTNDIVNVIPVFFGGKTGFSDLAGGNLTIVVSKGLNHPMIITVLGSSIDGRFEDVKTLYNQFAK